MRTMLCSSICFLLFNFVYAQYPDTIWVPVTFYDFHSDRTNPEFECRHSGQIRTGMVASTLGADNKPDLGSTPYLNYGIKKWFTPWTAGDYTIPNYSPHTKYKETFSPSSKEYGQTVSHLGDTTVDYDTAFKNIEIEDNLPFVHVGNGIYRYLNTTFFPLDKRGFGNEWNVEGANHNFSFTMELHWQFVKKAGMNFKFVGDDDIWVYINKKLQMDIGGIHSADSGQFNVDNIDGLVTGKTYPLDIFYAERHSSASKIYITTNIISGYSSVKLYPEDGKPDLGTNQAYGPSVSVDQGQQVSINGHVFDSSGTWVPENDGQITYTVKSTCGDSGIVVSNGIVTFTPTVADCQITITSTFIDNKNQQSQTTLIVNVRDTSTVSHYKLDLYPGSVPTGATKLPDMVTITAGNTYDMYAHVFDSSNRWKQSYDNQVTWELSGSSSGTSLAITNGTHQVFTGTQPGTYTVTARFSDPANTARIATDEITVVVQAALAPYKLDLYPGTDPTGATPLSNKDTITAGQTYDIYAHVFDTSNVWVPSDDNVVTWKLSNFSSGASLAITTGSHQVFTGTKAGTYTITATFQDPDNAQRPASTNVITIVVKAAVFAAYKLDFYPGTDPTGATPISNRDTITAGQTYDIYAHVFDTSNVWVPSDDNVVTWKLSNSSSGASLTVTTGSHQVFTSTKAGTYTITATFQDPNNAQRPASTRVMTIVVLAPVVPVSVAYKLDLYPGAIPTGAKPLPDRDTVSAGEAYDIYAHVFDTSNGWKSTYDNVVTWELSDSSSGASLSITTGSHQVFTAGTKAGTEYTIMATFQDPDNPARPKSTSVITLVVKSGEAKYINIMTDTTNYKTQTGEPSFVFSEDQVSQSLYAVGRDAYGNVVGLINVNWKSDNSNAVLISPTTNSKTSTMTKGQDNAGTETHIIAYKDGLTPDSLRVSSKGKQSSGAINPFIPGVTQIPNEVEKYYPNVINYYDTRTGTLVSVTTSLPLEPVENGDPNNKTSYGNVKIYDAVGNLIRTDLRLIKANPKKPNVYGIVWDGRNCNKRYVGSGVYLVDIYSKQTDGTKVNTRIKIGVKKPI